MENIKEMDNFLNRHHLLKLNQDQVNVLNRSITYKEIEEVIKTLQTKKSLRTNSFSPEFYQNFKEELIPILLKLFHIIETAGTFPDSF